MFLFDLMDWHPSSMLWSAMSSVRVVVLNRFSWVSLLLLTFRYSKCLRELSASILRI